MYITRSKNTLNSRNLKRLIIAIDGPAAAGKSTTAKLAAERLGYLYVDTGAMYRAMTLKVLARGIAPDNDEEIGKLAEATEIRLQQDGEELRVWLDGRDVAKEIRSPSVTKAVSAVSSIKKVREVMVREQQRMGSQGGIVLEGRDIGTVVFPQADLKIYMVARVDERARRRQHELRTHGVQVPVDDMVQEIVERDRKDSQRKVSPLRKAEDALVLDTSTLTIGEQVEYIVSKAENVLRHQA